MTDTAVTPPHNLAAEVHVLGSMLQSRVAIVDAMTRLTGEDFYRGSHRTIFEAIVALHVDDTPVDHIVLADRLADNGRLEDIGGAAALYDLSDQVPHALNCAWYADIVAEQAAKRRLLALSIEMANRARTDTAVEAAQWATQQLEQQTPTRSTLRVLVGDAIDNLSDPTWMIDRILPEGLSMLFGPPGAGKSFLALSWACSIASRSSWFGHQPMHAPVIYIAAEGAGGIKLRRRSWLTANQQHTLPHLAVIPEAVDPTDAGQAADLIRTITDLSAGLVVWDTVARCMTGDENGTEDAKRFVAALDRIRNRTAVSHLLVHHSGKDRERGARGSTVIEGACDGVLVLTQPIPGTIKLSTRKAKDAAPPRPMDFTLRQWGPSAVLQQIRTTSLSAVDAL